MYTSDKKDLYTTLKDFIDKHSCGAYCRFNFTIDDYDFHCISTDDFKEEYGRVNLYKLTSYVVMDYRTLDLGCDQGTDFDLKLTTKELFEQEKRRYERSDLTNEQVDILKRFCLATLNIINRDYVPWDISSEDDFNLLRTLTLQLKTLDEKTIQKIMKLVQEGK